MSRFFVAEKNVGQDTIRIDEPGDVKHLSRVLRHKVGDVVEISDGSAFEYRIQLTKITDREAEGLILDKQEFYREPGVRLKLYQSIPKQSKMETIVQKAVELGACEIVPMITQRTIVLDRGNFEKKRQRWQSVAQEAAKQSRRGLIPEVGIPSALETVLEEMQENDCNLFFFEEEQNLSVKAFLRELIKGRPAESEPLHIGVIIGPEGGFSEEEAKRIVTSGACSVSMGRRILRVETAAAAAMAMVMYELELI